jgi:hypothetical protein
MCMSGSYGVSQQDSDLDMVILVSSQPLAPLLPVLNTRRIQQDLMARVLPRQNRRTSPVCVYQRGVVNFSLRLDSLNLSNYSVVYDVR